MESLLAPRLATLGHSGRLAIFRLLMRRYPDQLPAGEIAQALDVKPSTLSAYLSSLLQAGLVTQERHGTSLRYGIDLASVRGTFDALLRDCCRGRPDICLTPVAGTGRLTAPLPGRKFRVLFVCTGNSARSIFAEAILRTEAGGRFEAYSAGTRPFSAPNPWAIDLLRQKGHDVSGLRAKHLAEFQAPDAPRMDFVFTVCDQAANEECPAWEGWPISAHWGIPDPVRAAGSEAERSLAFQQAYGTLRHRIRAFSALPFATLDRIALQAAVDDLARPNSEIDA